MGYSLRKGPTPDFAGAEKFYNEALRIDPGIAAPCAVYAGRTNPI